MSKILFTFRYFQIPADLEKKRLPARVGWPGHAGAVQRRRPTATTGGPLSPASTTPARMGAQDECSDLQEIELALVYIALQVIYVEKSFNYAEL